MLDPITDSSCKAPSCNLDDGKMTAFDGEPKVPSARQGKYNKSIDFDRHKTTSTRKGTKCKSKENVPVDAYEESYATFGESFMGESFANLSMSVLALDNLDDDDSEYDDECNKQLENIISKQITQKSRLDSIIDFEDDEEDKENQ